METLQKKSGLNIFCVFVLLPMLIVLALALTGCDGGGGSDSSYSQASLELGETTNLGSATVGTNGSLLSVDSPDDPLNGLEIDVPEGAYQEETEFTLSYAPITSHSGIQNFDPVTPLITVKNGGEYADELLTLKIPVTMEDGYHYMVFYYDETTGELEGIPEIEHDATSLTVATRHFSSILVNRVGLALILDDFDSGFQVTQDNWPFENIGTYLSPGGICSGMSIASLYYYDEKNKKMGEPALNGKYDYGVSGWGLDDEQAIKLCSVLQWWEGNFQSDALDRWHVLGEEKNPVWTYLMFSHSILLTGRPQYVAIYPEDDSAGHAMVVYKKSGNDLYVADPNLPEDKNVKIEFEWDGDDQLDTPTPLSGTFKPFESQWNVGTDKIDFTKIYYIGKTALIDSDFDDLWDKLDQQTLGDRFPDYDLKIIEKDATGTERKYDLTDGYETTNNVVQVKVETYEFDARLTGFYADSTIENNETEIVEITLLPGDNNIGFLIEAEVDCDVTNQKEWAWTDFKYVNITYENEDAPEPTDPPEPAEELSVTVTNTYDRKVHFYLKECGTNNCWSIFSERLEPGEIESTFVEPGEYEIVVYLAEKRIVQWNRQVSLTDQDFFYDFAATQDCTKARISITNQTQLRLSFKFKGYNNSDSSLNTWSLNIEPGETTDYYFDVGETYSLWARGYIGCPDGVNLSSACYSCWSEPSFVLDCEGYEWIVSGSGSTCE